MNLPNPILFLLSVLLISVFLITGCSTTTGSVLPQDGPSMVEVYHNKMKGNEVTNQHLGSVVNKTNVADLDTADINLFGYTRTAGNELQNLFPSLPNPTIVMYVYPHLAGSDEAPVPGYATAFTLFKENQFALPGEIIKRG